ncbi:IPT/TIG domain-containing protein [Fulvivirga ulvae]|uniref:FISUMP domain-containing protein n=1 Tax=Fulvivirga ulvae TaxID=2904245 RepID=UPI001F1EFA8F|nr:FISUMP domain-containing protein [Fulvivirga ulvae]UII29811.1 IPT/TIG domain-containing protein [Fulvivirga ulvae]
MKIYFSEPTKKSLLALILLTIMAVSSSCSDDDGDGGPAQATITGIDPVKGEVGDVVTIKGTNFSTTAPDNIVSFNGVQASVTSSTATEIKTTVPVNATTGKITVSVNELNPVTSSVSFEVYNCTELTLTLTSGGYSIETEVNGGTAPYEYALDDGSFQSASSFDVDAIDHSVKVKDANGCEASANITAAVLKTFTDDRDGQIYNVVKMGDQIWLGENFNLNTNASDSTSSWCPEDVAVNCDTHGRLYTWYVASEMAPEGWKLPSQADWEMLISTAGGMSTAGKSLKEGSMGLQRAGNREDNGTFGTLGGYGNYWSSEVNVNEQTEMSNFEISSSDAIDNYFLSGKIATSVRLIKD